MESFDWKNLGFGYCKTAYNVRSYFKDGKWGELEVSTSEYINMHMASTCLHYGQEVFEGLKAYRGKDDKIRLFRWKENAHRMQSSANGILMEPVPVELFEKAIRKAIEINKEAVPPYGTGATLYVRPLLIGTGAQVGVKPADEYLFLVFVTPVGPYFKDGFKPVDICIDRTSDRAAPLGTGIYKVGGNYAASLVSAKRAHDAGFASVLYLDAGEKRYIDECGPANFFGIKGSTYITPKSTSILPSITNDSLMTIAKNIGMTVERRKILVEELNDFDEVGACGTAAVITPVKSITDIENKKVYSYCKNDKPGEISHKLYQHLVSIQNGEEEDINGWIDIID